MVGFGWQRMAVVPCGHFWGLNVDYVSCVAVVVLSGETFESLNG